ncbi:MAG: hypothetical protein IPL40_06035 [Proteobacteria bacterium]|nr:hypothetical protein [Pseudomonadota bacterium]
MPGFPVKPAYVGERVRIEGVARHPLTTSAPVVALAEDRHRVLNPDTTATATSEPLAALLRRSARDVWAVGDIVVRGLVPRVLLDVVVYDLEARPIVEAAGVTRGLVALMDELSRRQLTSAALEPIGMAHGGISAETLAQALHGACAHAPFGLQLQLCDPNRWLLREVLEALAALERPH